MKTTTSIGLSLALLASSNVSSWAQVTFSFDYSGASHFTPEAKASLEAAASIAGGYFAHNATIDIQVTSVNNAGSTLASAGSAFVGLFNNDLQLGFANRGVVGHKIITNGTDANGANFDGTVEVNFGQSWDFDDNIAAGHFDFKSTMIHELLHAAGFSAGIRQDGKDLVDTAPGNPGYWAPFDEFLADSSGSLIDSGTFILDAAAWNAAVVGGTGASPASNGLYFNGPNAVAAFGGPVPLYSPNPFETGSSVSHTDDNFFDGGTESMLLMNAATSAGPGLRNLSDLEIGILKDVGFTVVPEPHEYAMLAGLGLMLLVVVRRRQVTSGAPC